MAKDYEVGYGKPPKHTQFKPGKSGNPKGRSKGSKNLKTELNDALQEVIPVKIGGKKKKVTKQTAIVQMLLQKVLGGDLKATQTLLLLLSKLQIMDATPDSEMAFSTDDDNIIKDFMSSYPGKTTSNNGVGHE